MLKRAAQHGFTLIELMVAALLGLFVILAVTGVFISTYQANSQNLKVVRMDEEMRAAMTLMARDIRRAGTRELAWQSSVFLASGADNPFDTDQPSGTLQPGFGISKYGAEPDDSCVIFSYDRMRNDNPADARNFVGYRLQASGIESRGTVSAESCAIAPSLNGWQGITDREAWAVTDLNFTTTLEPGVPGVDLRTVTVTLEGAVNTRASNPTLNDAGAALTSADCAGNTLDIVCRRLVEKVRIRNDAIL